MTKTISFCSLVLVMSCAGGDPAAEESDEDLTSSPSAAGIVAGSVEETSVLNLVNDTTLDAAAYKTRVRLTTTVANAVVKYRAGASAATTDDRYFGRIQDVDALPSTGITSFKTLGSFAKLNGYDFAPPTLGLLEIPDNLGRPPTTDDVRVIRGLDARTPDDASSIIRKNLSNSVHPQNERLVSDAIARALKSLTIGAGNFFAEGSPPRRFLQTQNAAAKFTLYGSPSAIHPTILRVDDPFVGATYFRRTAGGYESLDASYLNDQATGLRYALLVACEIKLNPAKVRIEYLKWSAPQLTSPSTVVLPGG